MGSLTDGLVSVQCFILDIFFDVKSWSLIWLWEGNEQYRFMVCHGSIFATSSIWRLHMDVELLVLDILIVLPHTGIDVYMNLVPIYVDAYV